MRQELRITATISGGDTEILHNDNSYVTQTGALTAPVVFGMIGHMKIMIGAILAWLVLSGTSFAFDVATTEVAKPYDVVKITPNEYSQVVHMGTLDSFPIMYEFTLEESTELSFQLRTLANILPGGAFSLMIVRENDDGSGVTEVARQIAGNNNWQAHKDRVYGLTFLDGEVLTLAYEPGTYRVEVSTPVNEGKYLLVVGDTSDHLGYFATLNRAHAIQSHFGYSFVRLLTSSYLYYPFGIIMLLIIFERTWKFRNKISRA